MPCFFSQRNKASWLLGNLDLGRVGRIEGGYQVEDPLIEPLGDFLAGQPEIVRFQRGDADRAGGRHEIYQLAVNRSEIVIGATSGRSTGISLGWDMNHSGGFPPGYRKPSSYCRIRDSDRVAWGRQV